MYEELPSEEDEVSMSAPSLPQVCYRLNSAASFQESAYTLLHYAAWGGDVETIEDILKLDQLSIDDVDKVPV